MVKNVRKVMLLSVLTLSLGTTVPGYAATTSEASGGWSEVDGYYVNAPSGFGILASSSPDSHEGKRLSRKATDNSGDTEVAAFGATIWKDVRHYTTAQMEKNDGTVIVTSGRVYGVSSTAAQSPWYRLNPIFDFSNARTYWGKG